MQMSWHTFFPVRCLRDGPTRISSHSSKNIYFEHPKPWSSLLGGPACAIPLALQMQTISPFDNPQGVGNFDDADEHRQRHGSADQGENFEICVFCGFILFFAI